MSRMMHRLTTPFLAAALGSVAIAVFSASPAAAHTAAQACGSGYGTVASSAVRTGSGAVFGHVYLMFNSSNGRNCVVTIKEGSLHGPSTWTEAFLAVQGQTGPDAGWFSERGNFSHYAGGLPANKTVRFAATAKARSQ